MTDERMIGVWIRRAATPERTIKRPSSRRTSVRLVADFIAETDLTDDPDDYPAKWPMRRAARG